MKPCPATSCYSKSYCQQFLSAIGQRYTNRTVSFADRLAGTEGSTQVAVSHQVKVHLVLGTYAVLHVETVLSISLLSCSRVGILEKYWICFPPSSNLLVIKLRIHASRNRSFGTLSLRLCSCCGQSTRSIGPQSCGTNITCVRSILYMMHPSLGTNNMFLCQF